LESNAREDLSLGKALKRGLSPPKTGERRERSTGKRARSYFWRVKWVDCKLKFLEERWTCGHGLNRQTSWKVLKGG